MRRTVVLLFWITLGVSIWGQQPPRKKPVLIREDRTAEAEAEPEVILPDPVKAQKSLEVGDFYFRRGSYKAAVERYRDAVDYAPAKAKPYEKLTRALEKLKEFSKAVEVCEEFIHKNPTSGRVNDFEKRAQKLSKKIQM